jgi:hypothetical protein
VNAGCIGSAGAPFLLDGEGKESLLARISEFFHQDLAFQKRLL